MLMGNSVEGRFPFLDFNLVNFANKLPSEHKLFNLDEKFILKKAFTDMLPDSIIKRSKQPYRVPDAASFFNNVSFDWIDEALDDNTIKEAGIFNPVIVDRLHRKCKKFKGLKMSNIDNMRIVVALSTMLVHKHFIKFNFKRNSKLIEPERVIDRI